MQLTILGPGCAKCLALAQFAERAARELGLSCELIKVTVLKQLMAPGVMLTPALAINDTLKVVGKVPTVAGLKTLLTPAASAPGPTPRPHRNENRYTTLSLCILKPPEQGQASLSLTGRYASVTCHPPEIFPPTGKTEKTGNFMLTARFREVSSTP